jgi:predicted transcriptional regulator
MHPSRIASQKEYQDLIKRLVDRLERLSADSIYAHRASGLRGSLLRYVERLEASERLNSQEISSLEQLLEYGFTLLILSAEEVGGKA